MELSIKAISNFLEPIIALLMPFLLIGSSVDSIFEVNSLTVEEKSRITMMVMFSLFYFVKTLRKYELKNELEEVKNELLKIKTRIETLESTQPASARDRA